MLPALASSSDRRRHGWFPGLSAGSWMPFAAWPAASLLAAPIRF
jgi:hypothetical protein